jgi:hypothetical protein
MAISKKVKKPLWALIMDWIKPDSTKKYDRVQLNAEAKARQRAKDAANKARRDASYRQIGVDPD